MSVPELSTTELAPILKTGSMLNSTPVVRAALTVSDRECPGLDSDRRAFHPQDLQLHPDQLVLAPLWIEERQRLVSKGERTALPVLQPQAERILRREEPQNHIGPQLRLANKLMFKESGKGLPSAQRSESAALTVVGAGQNVLGERGTGREQRWSVVISYSRRFRLRLLR